MAPRPNTDPKVGNWRTTSFNFHLDRRCIMARFSKEKVELPAIPTKMPVGKDVHLSAHEKNASGLLFDE